MFNQSSFVFYQSVVERQSALQRLFRQQHQSQRLKETEQTDKEVWLCGMGTALQLIVKRIILHKLLNIMDYTAYPLHTVTQ